MRTVWTMTAMVVVGLGAAPDDIAAQLTDSGAVAAAERFIGLLQAGEWNAAESMVAPALRERLGAAQLEVVWGQIRGSLGEGEATRVRGVSVIDSMRAVELYGDFARDTVILRVVFSPGTEVSGFWVGPVPDDAPLAVGSPPYAVSSRFVEIDVEVGADPWLLPATLTVPAVAGRHPAVVLVHGSGPHDRDETVGGTKVFRDLAWGLATNGVAVLRYEKRTHVHGAKMGADVSVESEVIEDALAALDLVRAHPSVDPARIYVAGHSLGAHLAPEIARLDGRVAGAILLAATARPIGAVMEDQVQYLSRLPENAAPEVQAQFNAVLAQVRRLTSGEAADTEMVLGAPVSYFRDLEARDAVAEALGIDIPLLVLQGERDYQVTMTDFEIWREATRDRPATSLVSFPSLNHLFVTGSGVATPAEYARPAFVAGEVITTLLNWMGMDGDR
ncbi:MAG: alpha/beta fold hydrolase [Gemmatimonadetes bacterium]|nr:alpha/beta fold hydrolase [Gemmatimonadota bacterium]